MLKLITIFLLVAITSACMKKEETTVVTGRSASATSPMFWSGNPFPLPIYISNEFNSTEVTAIHNSAASWKTKVGNVDWFTFPATRPLEATNIPFNGEALGRDGQIVIYKTTNWQSQSGVIAYAQNMVTAYNEGTANEYRIISSSDIMVNYRNNTFLSSGATNDYDLETVLLHELGHMLGLLHVADYPYSNKSTSVMYPSIVNGDRRKTPLQDDINKLAALYNVTLSGSGLGAASAAAPTEKFVPFDDGRDFIMQIELHENGECVHKEDGVIVDRHQSPHFKK